MKIRSITFFLICLLLAILTIPAIACPPPPCPDCKTWNPETEVCDWDCATGQCCYNDSCVDNCSGCQSCVNDYCEDNDDNCDGCRSCEGGWCNTDDDKCDGCEICNPDGICEDDDDNCLSSGPCKTCVDSVCEDDDTKCSGCKTCDGGSCEDDDDECIGCESCIAGFCEDDDNECGDCGFCFLGSCYDDDDQCLDCQNCIDNYCYDACPSGEICCPDETCWKKCKLSPTGHCDEPDQECRECHGSPSLCLDPVRPKIVYTGNDNYSCVEYGCNNAECVWGPDVHCSTKYDCVMWYYQDEHFCGFNIGTDRYQCFAFEGHAMRCYWCHQDPDDPGEPQMVTSRICTQ